MANSTLIDELLNDRSYHIEFNGHLTNHVKHAVIALAGLGASSEKINAYYNNYAKMTPYGYGLEPPKASSHIVTEANWASFLGQRTSFSAYCEFFDQQEKKLGLNEVLKRYLPLLLPGWAGAFTHATIHLGWALDANHRWMTIEGLAYMSFAYVSCCPERADSTENNSAEDEQAINSLLRIAGVWEDDRDALKQWVETLLDDTEFKNATGIHTELMRSGLQYRIARLLKEGHPLIYKTPTWIDGQDVSRSWLQLYYAMTLLYLAKPGDFILLHLITSLYAMEQISKYLPENEQKKVVKHFWIGMLCIVFSGADFPKRSKLAALHKTFRDAVDEGGHTSWHQDWKILIARAIEEEEEHNPKLVYVLQQVWKRTGCVSIYRFAAGQLTLTPELPPSFDLPPSE
ncbi:MAG: questin oxidase family protein [Brasilonema angustatum HA4187-MV1]|jgi:hypothetical protein|nr:questin oxidase family protein [Brasilonema angustatum HA4187-MV1]